jgi:hypothetical protein
MAEQSGVSVECPLCGETFDATAAGGWCTNPDCGEWQYEEDQFLERWSGADDEPGAIPTGASHGAGEDGTPTAEQSADDERGRGDIEGEPTAIKEDEAAEPTCPSCDGSVTAADNFCASCGTDLESHAGAGTVTAEKTRVGATADTLVLATRGEEIEIEDGDTLGRRLRRIVIETGGDEDQAVRIHRKHVRFVREDGRFYMADLGTNPTRLNGRPLQKGDREPVSAGDEIELSGVIGLVVREP